MLFNGPLHDFEEELCKLGKIEERNKTNNGYEYRVSGGLVHLDTESGEVEVYENTCCNTDLMVGITQFVDGYIPF